MRFLLRGTDSVMDLMRLALALSAKQSAGSTSARANLESSLPGFTADAQKALMPLVSATVSGVTPQSSSVNLSVPMTPSQISSSSSFQPWLCLQRTCAPQLT